MDGRYIIQDRLIFAATNLAPLLSLRGKWVFEISAAHKYVKDWQRTFEKEKESTRIEQARQSSKAKKQKTSAASEAAAPEERCEAIKAWPGQDDVEDAIPLVAGEIVFLLRDDGDGWSKVRRERDGTEGAVPTKRLRKAPPPPPSEEVEAEEEEAAPAPVPAPDVSSDEEEARAEAERADAEAWEEANFVEAAHAEGLAREEADAAECGYGTAMVAIEHTAWFAGFPYRTCVPRVCVDRPLLVCALRHVSISVSEW